MGHRPTVQDVAARAKVSVATVDRVLNGRAKVREETARKVYEAAREIGYHAAGLIHQRMQADKPVVRLGFVLNKERQAFYRDLVTQIETACRDAVQVRAIPRIVFSPSQSPGDFAACMEGLAGEVDVIAATAVSHSTITQKVIDLKRRGVPCIAMMNDFAQGERLLYIGLNNMKVGRIAASMIHMAVPGPGKVAVFVGGYRWHGHELRETGFRSYMREHGVGLQMLDTLVNLETRQLTYEATLDLLDRNPDLRGIYCAGGGMEGAIAALREARASGDVALVVNEITADSRDALVDRFATMVIATPIERLCRELVATMVAVGSGDATKQTGQHFLRPDLYLPESVA
jgi:LacI family transcriptional regulator